MEAERKTIRMLRDMYCIDSNLGLAQRREVTAYLRPLGQYHGGADNWPMVKGWRKSGWEGTGLDKCISVDDLLQSMLGATGNRLRRWRTTQASPRRKTVVSAFHWTASTGFCTITGLYALTWHWDIRIVPRTQRFTGPYGLPCPLALLVLWPGNWWVQQLFLLFSCISYTAR